MTPSTWQDHRSNKGARRSQQARPKTALFALFALFTLFASACGSVSEQVANAMADTAEESAEVDAVEAAFDDAGVEESVAIDVVEATEGREGIAADPDVSAAAPTAPPTPGTGTVTAAGQTATEIGREIIFAANVVVGVDDVAASGLRATEVIEDLGGFVFGQESIGGNEPQTVLVFKVRPDDFQTALESLGGLGELRNQSVTTDDVTERVVDLESRIQTTELGVERLRSAMEQATDIADFAVLEQQLLARESDLEVLRGTLRTLRDQIDLSTITVTFVQDRVDNAIRVHYSHYEGHDAAASCPGSSDTSFDSGDDATLCFEIINDGDQTLTDLTFTETALEIDDIADVSVVFGDVDDIAPGQSVMLATTIEVERSLNLRVTVTATPTNGALDERGGPVVRATSTPQLFVPESARVAGFGDGFETGSALLTGLWQFAQVLAGFVLPLLILLPFAWLALLGVRKLFGRLFTGKTAPTNAAPPAPPGPGEPGNSPTSPTPPAPAGSGDEFDDDEDAQTDEEFVMAGSPSTVDVE